MQNLMASNNNFKKKQLGGGEKSDLRPSLTQILHRTIFYSSSSYSSNRLAIKHESKQFQRLSVQYRQITFKNK